MCTREEVLLQHTQQMEYQTRVLLPAASAAAGRTVDSSVCIVDMRGASMRLASAAALGIVRAVAAIDQARG